MSIWKYCPFFCPWGWRFNITVINTFYCTCLTFFFFKKICQPITSGNYSSIRHSALLFYPTGILQDLLGSGKSTTVKVSLKINALSFFKDELVFADRRVEVKSNVLIQWKGGGVFFGVCFFVFLFELSEKTHTWKTQISIRVICWFSSFLYFDGWKERNDA